MKTRRKHAPRCYNVRSQRVRLCDIYSTKVDVVLGFDNVSVLGPVFFNIYLRSFHSILHNNGFEVTGFADDCHISKHFHCQSQLQSVLTYGVLSCLHAVDVTLNHQKTSLNKNYLTWLVPTFSRVGFVKLTCRTVTTFV